MSEPTQRTRHELMQMASRGAPTIFITYCTGCTALVSPGLTTLVEGEHLIVAAIKTVPKCKDCMGML